MANSSDIAFEDFALKIILDLKKMSEVKKIQVPRAKIISSDLF